MILELKSVDKIIAKTLKNILSFFKNGVENFRKRDEFFNVTWGEKKPDDKFFCAEKELMRVD